MINIEWGRTERGTNRSKRILFSLNVFCSICIWSESSTTMMFYKQNTHRAMSLVPSVAAFCASPDLDKLINCVLFRMYMIRHFLMRDKPCCWYRRGRGWCREPLGRGGWRLRWERFFSREYLRNMQRYRGERRRVRPMWACATDRSHFLIVIWRELPWRDRKRLPKSELFGEEWGTCSRQCFDRL